MQSYIIITSNPRVLEKKIPQNKEFRKIFFVEWSSEDLTFIGGNTNLHNMNGVKKANVKLRYC